MIFAVISTLSSVHLQLNSERSRKKIVSSGDSSIIKHLYVFHGLWERERERYEKVKEVLMEQLERQMQKSTRISNGTAWSL